MNIPYLKPILAGVLVTAWAGSIWYARDDMEKKVMAEWNEERRLIATAVAKDSEDKRLQTEQRIRIAEQVAEDAKKTIEEQARKLTAYKSSVSGLRSAEASLRATLARCNDPSASVGGVSSDTTDRVLADMRRRLDEAEERTIRYADQLRISNQACVRQYNEVRATQNK